MKKKRLSQSKAKIMLHEGVAHGKPITDKQRRFFGAVASGQPIKTKEKGGASEKPDNVLIPEDVYWSFYAVDRKFVDTNITISKWKDGSFDIVNEKGDKRNIENVNGTKEGRIWKWLNGLDKTEVGIFEKGGKLKNKGMRTFRPENVYTSKGEWKEDLKNQYSEILGDNPDNFKIGKAYLSYDDEGELTIASHLGEKVGHWDSSLEEGYIYDEPTQKKLGFSKEKGGETPNEHGYLIYVTPQNTAFKPHIWVQGGWFQSKGLPESIAETLRKNKQDYDKRVPFYSKVEVRPATEKQKKELMKEGLMEVGGELKNKFISIAPQDTVFVKVNSHRASHKIDSNNIPKLELYNFYGSSSAGQSIILINKNDYDKIKHIKGVSEPSEKLRSEGMIWRPKLGFGSKDLTSEQEKLYEAYKKINEKEMAKGGEIENKGIDLFEEYEKIPSKVGEILNKYEQGIQDGDYEILEKAKEELEKIGYTFEYYLDGLAYDLRKIGEMGKVEYAEKHHIGLMGRGGEAQSLIDLIKNHGLSVRKIPEQITHVWSYRKGDEKKEGAEVIERVIREGMSLEKFEEAKIKLHWNESFGFRWEDGKVYRKSIKEVTIPKHAGWWMCKVSPPNTSTNDSWSLKTDNLSPTLEESVKLCVEKIYSGSTMATGGEVLTQKELTSIYQSIKHPNREIAKIDYGNIDKYKIVTDTKSSDSVLYHLIDANENVVITDKSRYDISKKINVREGIVNMMPNYYLKKDGSIEKQKVYWGDDKRKYSSGSMETGGETLSKEKLQEDISSLNESIKSDTTSESLKEDMRKKVVELQGQLTDLEKKEEEEIKRSQRNVTIPENKFWVDIDDKYKEIMRKALGYDKIQYESKTIKGKLRVFVESQELLDRIVAKYNMKRAKGKDKPVSLYDVSGKSEKGGKLWSGSATKKEISLRNKARRMGILKNDQEELSETHLKTLENESPKLKKKVSEVRKMKEFKN